MVEQLATKAVTSGQLLCASRKPSWHGEASVSTGLSQFSHEMHRKHRWCDTQVFFRVVFNKSVYLVGQDTSRVSTIRFLSHGLAACSDFWIEYLGIIIIFRLYDSYSLPHVQSTWAINVVFSKKFRSIFDGFPRKRDQAKAFRWRFEGWKTGQRSARQTSSLPGRLGDLSRFVAKVMNLQQSFKTSKGWLKCMNFHDNTKNWHHRFDTKQWLHMA